MFLKSTSIKRKVEFHKAAAETEEPRSLLQSYQIFMNCLMHLVSGKIKILGGSLLNQTEEKWLSGETLQVLLGTVTGIFFIACDVVLSHIISFSSPLPFFRQQCYK